MQCCGLHVKLIRDNTMRSGAMNEDIEGWLTAASHRKKGFCFKANLLSESYIFHKFKKARREE
jgi:hypothetical protein